MADFAYIITAYTDHKQLKRLVDSLGNEDFFIHVDKKIEETNFKEQFQDKENVKFVENRKEIRWGGFSQVDSLTELLRCVKQTNKKYKRVICLSGTDYPAVSLNKIKKAFEDQNIEYINSIDITDNNNYSNKVTQYWNFDIKNNNKTIERINRILTNQIRNKLLFLLGKRKKDFLYINNQKWDVYFGSDYWALTYDCAMYVYEMLNKKEVVDYFKTSYVPSELIINTIVFNSKYKENANLINIKKEEKIRYEKLCALHYEIYEPLIKVMTIDDYEDIVNSNKLFFRKAKSGESDSLIERLNSENNC